MTLQLYGFFRSTASWRVRIALNLKGIATEHQSVHLIRDGGEHKGATYAALNPEKLVPTLQDGAFALSQSLAILEYLEETHPSPALLPQNAIERAWVRSIAALMACDIHPLVNLRVTQYLEQPMGVSSEAKLAWCGHWTAAGLAALETRLTQDGRSGSCCFGDVPTFADCCLAPQVQSARSFNVPLTLYPTVLRIDAHLAELDAFRRAVPALQPDAS